MKISRFVLLLILFLSFGCKLQTGHIKLGKTAVAPIHPCAPMSSALPVAHAKSLTTSFGTDDLGNSSSAWPRISSSNRIVAYYSFATDLVNPGTTNQQAFYFDMNAGTTNLLSAKADGTVANGISLMANADCIGRYIAFVSRATNLTSDVVSGTYHHVFLKDIVTGEIKLVSSDANGVPGNASSGFDGLFPQVSIDGRYVSFVSNATNFVSPVVTPSQIYRKDMLTGEMILVTKNTAGDFATGGNNNFDMSHDGNQFVIGVLSANFPDANTFRQIYLKDISQNTITLLSKNGAAGNSNSSSPSFSKNGEYVVFYSAATNLTADSHGAVGASHFRLKLSDGSIQHVGQGTTACCNRPTTISFDGNHVAWLSNQSMDGITNSISAVWVKNMTTGERRIVQTNESGNTINNRGEVFSISGDGKYVLAMGVGTNFYPLDSDNIRWQLYLSQISF